MMEHFFYLYGGTEEHPLWDLSIDHSLDDPEQFVFTFLLPLTELPSQ